LVLLLKAACLVGKATHTNLLAITKIVLGLSQSGMNPQSITLETNTIMI